MQQLNIFHEHVMEACIQRGMSEEAVLLEAKKAGVDGLECDWQRLVNTGEKAKLFDGCGMRVESIYRSFDMGNRSAEETRGEYMQLFDIAAALGAKKVLCVPGFILPGEDETGLRRKMNERLLEMCMAARSYGITVTLEDYDNSTSPCSTIGGLKQFFDAVEELRFSFDTGNFAYSAEDAGEAYQCLREKIVHVHLKDRTREKAFGNPEDNNWINDVTGQRMYPVPVCEGYIGIPALLQQLKKDGYTGSFSLEHFGAADQLEYMLRSAKNVRAALKSL